jgi:hypothetical protein
MFIAFGAWILPLACLGPVSEHLLAAFFSAFSLDPFSWDLVLCD